MASPQPHDVEPIPPDELARENVRKRQLCRAEGCFELREPNCDFCRGHAGGMLFELGTGKMLDPPGEKVITEADRLRGQLLGWADLLGIDEGHRAVFFVLNDYGRKAALKASRVGVELAKAKAQRDRLATDALAALAGAGIATPEETYLGAPWALGGDIERLAKERNEARSDNFKLNQMVEQAARDVAALKLEVQRLAEQLEIERGVARDQRDELVSDKTEVERERDGLRTALDECQRDFDVLRAEMDAARSELQAQDGQRTVDAVRVVLKFLKKTEADGQAAQAKAAAWEGDARKAAADRAELAIDVNRWSAANAKLAEENDRLSRLRTADQREMEGLRRLIAEGEAKLVEAKKQDFGAARLSRAYTDACIERDRAQDLNVAFRLVVADLVDQRDRRDFIGGFAKSEAPHG